MYINQQSKGISMSKMACSSVDRISSLPDKVKERILLSLPLRDAAKCSILSTKWKNLWTYLPTLVIDRNFVDPIVPPQKRYDYLPDVAERLIMLEVCNVLMLHRGPLKNFSLTVPDLRHHADRVVRLLPFETIERLTIMCGTGGQKAGSLSKTLFKSFSQLKTLSMSFCTLSFSAVSFEGFDRLTVLELRHVHFLWCEAQLTFRCPLLTTLILDRCDDRPPYLRIVVEEAPILECLYLVGHFSYLLMNATSLLKTLTVHKMPILNDPSPLWPREVCSTVETLSIGISNICEYITPSEPWVKLRQMSLVEYGKRSLNTRTNVLAVVRMIMNSPNLQKLEIQMNDARTYYHYKNSDDEDVDITELRDVASEYEQILLLKKVELKSVRGTKNEMTLISWLLNSIPALDEMKIQMFTELSKDELLRVVIQLNKLQRASSKAEIIIN